MTVKLESEVNVDDPINFVIDTSCFGFLLSQCSQAHPEQNKYCFKSISKSMANVKVSLRQEKLRHARSTQLGDLQLRE